MNIETVRLKMVGVHDDAALQLPASGAVVVTGRNGSGKSSFVEAVALALWGESLRGEPLWRDGVGGQVEVDLWLGKTSLVVTRKRTKAGAKSLAFSVDGAEPVKYETPTKAQEALEALVGTFDSWRRTCVLSSADSAHFSLATDAERKRLLERLLGLDRLDVAADAARADLRKLESRLALAQQDARNTEGHLATAKARVKEATEAYTAAAGGGSAPPPVDVGRAKQALQVAQEERADTGQQLGEAREELATVKAAAVEAERRHARCASAVCPTCEQPIPEALRASLEAELKSATAKVTEASTRLRAYLAGLEQQDRELQAEIDQLRGAIQQQAATVAQEARMAGLRAKLDQQLRDAQAAVEKSRDVAIQAADKLLALEADASAQKVVTEVFGFKGVRAHLLDKALRQVERVANRHLGTLGNGMRVAVTSTTEKKTGGTSEAISLRVSVGGAAPRPYASLSGGERRRVDVALLLALADVAGVVAGRKSSTLWLDEVFDALDGDGASAVGTLVGGLSTTRAVVVITHSDALVAEIQAARRLLL